MSEVGTIAACLVIGAWSALDDSAFGQFLLSRPLVSGTLTGAVLGDPGAGFLLGMLLEGVYLGGIPAGGTRLPEPGPAAVGGVFAYVRLVGPGGLAIGTGLGVLLASLGGLTLIGQRLANGAITEGVATGAPEKGDLARAHWLCIGLDAIRGLAVTGLGLLAAQMMPEAWADRWPLGPAATVAMLVVPAAVTIGSMLREWIRTRSRAVLFLAGCGCGIALAWGS